MTYGLTNEGCTAIDLIFGFQGAFGLPFVLTTSITEEFT